MLLSLATLPVIANPAWKEALLDNPTWSVLVVLASAVGMPYLLLSTTGPLMQAWYVRSFASMLPYRLYALSNLASMLALLSYPVFVEPYFPVLEQARAWSAAYVLFVLACLGSAWQSWKGVSSARENATTTAAPALRPAWSECLLWVSLAMTASTLLLAMTRHLTQDVAPVSFLWVLPLSIYLLSFILCFDAPRYYYRSGFLVALPFAFLALDEVLDGDSLPVPLLIALMSLSLFVFCMVCHGEQLLAPEHRRQATAYYCEMSGIGQVIRHLAGTQPLQVGVVGLGAGTLATYGRQGDTMRMYEINEQVLDLARSDFSYLADSPAQIVAVLGDGRLMLEGEAGQNFDLLAIDAFSGDSIPTHLLTIEAMQVYLRHLADEGVLALHITNRYLDLRPVVAAAARQLRMTALIVDFHPDADDLFCRRSVWVLIARPERAAGLLKEISGAETLAERPGFAVWTDGFSNLLKILK